ncbi:NAD(P)/FAD-dependent oxidoreductase [Labrys neptuniae]
MMFHSRPLSPPPKRVVIIGAGFAGLAAAKVLGNSTFDVTVIDRHNYHLFQPLLYQVATAGLSPADIASPIRSILRDYKNIRVVLANVSSIRTKDRLVIAEDQEIPYDILVVATGAQHAYFGHADWAAHAPGLKRVDDATYLRRRILVAFEKAETESNDNKRKALLTFVVVGGGPTGVEMAGAIAELARKALAADFRHIDPRSARVVLVQAAQRLLPTFPVDLSQRALGALERLGVEVELSQTVTACDSTGVKLGSKVIEAATVIWAAGVVASPAGGWLGVETDSVGRVKVDQNLCVPAHPDIFVIGDTSVCASANGKPLPGVAPVAKQQGIYIARLLKAREAGRSSQEFRYRDFGMMATIGRKSAVAQIGWIHLHGMPAWLLWSAAHIFYLIGFRNRLAVVLNWMWNYVTFQRGTRLITGLSGSRMEDMGMPAKAASDAAAPGRQFDWAAKVMHQ